MSVTALVIRRDGTDGPVRSSVEQLDDTELRTLVTEVAAELGASGPRDAGGVIREVLARAAGGADGGRVAATVREVLSGD